MNYAPVIFLMLWISLIAGYSRSISSDTYDTAGNLRFSVSNNDNGLYVSYTYDALNRLQSKRPTKRLLT